MSRLLRRVRNRRPSASLVISVLALAIATGGGTYAVASSGPKTETKIATRVVKKLAPKLSVAHAATADSATSAAQAALATNAENAAKATTASKASQADHATQADHADRAAAATIAESAAMASNALELGGVPASDFTQSGCGSLTGQIRGTVEVPSNFASTTFTSTGLLDTYNCSGQAVEARRPSTGEYEVKFPGNPARAAVASLVCCALTTYVGSPAPGQFQIEAIESVNASGVHLGNAGFVLIVP